MEIWLKMESNTKESFMLPVNPAAIGYGQSTNNTYQRVASGGERVVLGSRNLRQYNIESFFPKYGAQLKPIEYVKRLQSWAHERRVVKFYVQGSNINVNTVISNFEWEYRAGIEDIYYSIELKEYIPLKEGTEPSSQASVGTTATTDRVTTSKPATPKTYVVKSGDTLYLIAKKYYGDGGKWNTIYTKNKAIIGSNPNLIRAGQKLVIP